MSRVRVAGVLMMSWDQTLADLAGGRGAALKRHTFLLCGDEAQADDMVQEALVRAFARPLRDPRPGAAEAYVRAIMVKARSSDTSARRCPTSPCGCPAQKAVAGGGKPRARD